MKNRQCNYLRLFLTFLLICTTKLSAVPNYDFAIKWAREGELEKSIEALSRLHRENPQNKNLLYDYISILGWAKEDRKAVALSKKIDLDKAPDYTLQNIAKSARNIKKYNFATKVYVKGAKRFPNNSQFYLGLALTLSDMKRFKLSHRVFNKAKEKFPNDLDIKFAQARVYEEQKNYFDAMTIYQDLLQNPKVYDKTVIKLVGTLRRQGMPFRAQYYIDKNPKLFNQETKTSIKSDQAAFKLRWSARGFNQDGDNSITKDAKLKIDNNIKILIAQNSDITTNKRLQNAYFDKIIALNLLGEKDEIVSLYQYLKSHSIDMPYNILNIVSSAYLSQKKPKIAQQILHKSLQKNPKDFKTKILLFNAYSDNYDMHKAIALAENLDAKELPMIWDKEHLYKIENAKKSDTTLLRILAYEYSGYLNYAQKELEEIVSKAPQNEMYRNTLAKLYYYRGWYDKSIQQYQILINNNPKDFDAIAGKVLVLIKKRDYKNIDKILQNIEYEFPDKKREIQEIYKTLNKENKSSFRVRSSYGNNLDNANQGTSDAYNIDAYNIDAYYSIPLNFNLKALIFTKYSGANFDQTKLDNRRYGIGLVYEGTNITTNAKLAYNETILKKFAPSILINWRINDKFSISTKSAYFSDQTPLRAILYGIRADLFKTSIIYRVNESKITSLSYEKMDFTDKNSRDSINFMHYQRLIFGPYYNLDSRLYAGGMKNSQKNMVYYNPKEDYYISLEFKNIWNLYKFYDFYIKQIIGAEFGTHYEKGYGSKMIGSLNFEQEWSLNENFGFDFGYIRKRSSYDGTLEYANKIFLNINGRF